jgi:hypothetical protein
MQASNNPLRFAAFYILSRPKLRKALCEELGVPMANWPRCIPTWAELEKLALLTAVIKETLRYAILLRWRQSVVLLLITRLGLLTASCIACLAFLPTYLSSMDSIRFHPVFP